MRRAFFYDIYVVEEADFYLSISAINFFRQIIKHKKHQYTSKKIKKNIKSKFCTTRKNLAIMGTVNIYETK